MPHDATHDPPSMQAVKRIYPFMRSLTDRASLSISSSRFWSSGVAGRLLRSSRNCSVRESNRLASSTIRCWRCTFLALRPCSSSLGSMWSALWPNGVRSDWLDCEASGDPRCAAVPEVKERMPAVRASAASGRRTNASIRSLPFCEQTHAALVRLGERLHLTPIDLLMARR